MGIEISPNLFIMELKEKNNPWLFFSRIFKSDKNYTPSNLCTLFWLGIGGFIFTILSPIMFVINSIFAKRDKMSLLEYLHYNDNGILGNFLLDKVIILVYITLTMLFSTIFRKADTFWDIQIIDWFFGPLIILICLGIGVLFIIGIYYIIKYFINIIKTINTNKNNKKKKEPSIVIEFVKAKKKKICPMIKWI